MGDIWFATSPGFIRNNTVECSSRAKSPNVNSIGKCFTLITEADTSCIQHRPDHLKEYSNCSFSNAVLLWGIRNCCFMHNTIVTAKFDHGLVDEFRTIVTIKAVNFLSRLPLKHYQNITDSGTSLILTV